MPETNIAAFSPPIFDSDSTVSRRTLTSSFASVPVRSSTDSSPPISPRTETPLRTTNQVGSCNIASTTLIPAGPKSHRAPIYAFRAWRSSVSANASAIA